ncbi:MAG: DUF554 domain-containing protein [Clostridiales bacterium]|nr:DUF554 domain-containing protein [Clostridiales bacterium]
MFGVLVNSVGVAVGCGIGLLLGKAVPERVGKLIMQGLALVIMYLGISGALNGQNALVLILSLVLGAVAGELLDLDAKLHSFADRLERRFKKDGQQGSLAEAFITTTIIMCTGALAVIGPLQAALTGDNSLIFTKSTIDFIAAIIFSSAMGIGVGFTAFSLLIYQGFFALAGGLLAPLLSDYAIAEITCAGSVLLIGMGLNMLGLTKLKIMNLLPSVFMPMLLCLIIK